MIRPTARIRLTEDDTRFIASTLASNETGEAAIYELLASPDERDLVLDDADLFASLVTYPNMTRVSTHLYFYVLVRHTLRQRGFADRALADYIASMLAEFSKPNRANRIAAGHERQYDYVVDLVQDLIDADSEKAFLIRSHLGNFCMFTLGVFPDRVHHRARHARVAPDPSYYEQMGRSGYRQAASSRHAQKWELDGTLSLLGRRFQEIRYALNEMVDAHLNIDARPQSTEKAMRRVDAFIAQRRHLM